ncbi:MAG: DedA family protein [Kyrpidia tusciae]|nr:DedA family protein [Kyrpidia tusciae]MBE3552321.1 DedA family protein [Kyrpidia tusciae]
MSSLLAAISDFTIQLVQSYGYLGIFIGMTLESACIPLPSEVIMPFAGYMVGRGFLNLGWVILAGTAGNVVGSLIAYYVGIRGGRAFLERYGRYIWIHHRHLDQADHWFARRGEVTVFVGRLLPAIRTFISLPAGIARMPVGRFILYSAVGSLPWVWVLALVGVKLGQHWESIQHYTHPLTLAVGVAVLAAIVIFVVRGKRKQR